MSATPGPWTATFDTTVQGLPSWRIDSPTRNLTASLVFLPGDPETAAEVAANAKLIAAAPSMLAALKNLATMHGSLLVNLGRQEDDPCGCDRCRYIRAVIAEAESGPERRGGTEELGGVMRITATQRADDWIAHLFDNSRTWECGATAVEAIGRLMISLGEVTFVRRPARAPGPIDDGFTEPKEFIYSGSDRELSERTAQATANLRQSRLKVWKLGERYGITEWGADLSADGGIVVYQARPVEPAGDLLGARRFA